MRITNQMMINNTMSNIQVNKNQLNTLDNQLSTQKKINKPSDDPVIAIRALRLRSSLDQVTQYLDKNIPDASSWLDTTEGALDEAYSILQDLYSYCTQGATDSYSSAERDTLATSLDKLREAYYSQGDVEYAGRYCFTGYMTDIPLNYQSDEAAKDVDYIITQQFNREDLDLKVAYTNFYETDDILNLKYETDAAGNVVTPNMEEVHRIKLAYKDVSDTIDTKTVDASGNVTTTSSQYFKIKVTDSAGNVTEIAVNTITNAGGRTDKGSDTYIPKDDEVAFNPTTGELLFGENVYKELYEADSFSFTYEKNNFMKGDQNPIMYFDCVNNNKKDYYFKTE